MAEAMKFVVVFGVVAATYGLIRLGLYFGYRWVDKMLRVPEPVDLSKPIVRPLPRCP